MLKMTCQSDVPLLKQWDDYEVLPEWARRSVGIPDEADEIPDTRPIRFDEKGAEVEFYGGTRRHPFVSAEYHTAPFEIRKFCVWKERKYWIVRVNRNSREAILMGNGVMPELPPEPESPPISFDQTGRIQWINKL